MKSSHRSKCSGDPSHTRTPLLLRARRRMGGPPPEGQEGTRRVDNSKESSDRDCGVRRRLVGHRPAPAVAAHCRRRRRRPRHGLYHRTKCGGSADKRTVTGSRDCACLGRGDERSRGVIHRVRTLRPQRVESGREFRGDEASTVRPRGGPGG